MPRVVGVAVAVVVVVLVPGAAVGRKPEPVEVARDKARR
jgi:hypothetical protein